MRRPTRNLLYVVLGLVCVALLLQGVGLQIPKVLKMLTAVTAPSSTTVVQGRADASASLQMMQPASPQLGMDRELYGQYAPGEAVIITSKGWEPGETVTFTLHEQPQVNADRTWTTVADSSGQIFDNQLIAEANGGNVNHILTATGQRSGLVVQRSLNVTRTFDQCANGSPVTGVCAWTGGNLQANNSTYAEGMSTGQRLLFRGLTGTADHTLIFGFSYTDSSKHSYDWFNSWAQTSAEGFKYVGAAFDFGNGSGVVNLPSCVQYGKDDTAACNTLDNFIDVSVPNDAFVSAIAGAASGPQSGTDSCTGAANPTGCTQDRINAFEVGPCSPNCGTEGDRTVRIWADQPFVAADTHFNATYGTKHTGDKTFTTVIGNGGDGTDANTFASYTLEFNCGSCTAVQLQWGAHIGIGK